MDISALGPALQDTSPFGCCARSASRKKMKAMSFLRRTGVICFRYVVKMNELSPGTPHPKPSKPQKCPSICEMGRGYRMLPR